MQVIFPMFHVEHQEILRLARAIASIEIAAGVTPGIRDAWPRESGFMEFSFSNTSCERPDREE